MVRPPTTTYNNSATNAYYDPYTKSIRYTVDYSKSNHADGVVVGGGALVGRIVDIMPVECHKLFFDMPGRVLMGEIMEIVDADEVETKKEVVSCFCVASSSGGTVDACLLLLLFTILSLLTSSMHPLVHVGILQRIINNSIQ